MPKKNPGFRIFLFLFAAAAVFGQGEQRYQKGAVLDDQVYSMLPRKATLSSSIYKGMPDSFSLKQFAPLPGDQADYGTSVAWASAYAARTIAESVALYRTNPEETTRNVFSPAYVYRRTRPDDPGCREGVRICLALNFMRDSGAVRMLEIEQSTDFPEVDLSHYRESEKHSIAGYVTLISKEDRQRQTIVTRIVKKSLTEGKPVIIGMNTPDSFFRAKGVWEPRDNPDTIYSGHAMCVVGYDDNKNGGSFEIINSWGREWGNNGFIWITYKAFADFVKEAYELSEDLAGFNNTVKFNGYARIEIPDRGSSKPVALALSPEGYYKTDVLSEGIHFYFILGVRESAYVYTFLVSQSSGNSSFQSPVLIFPQTGVSPLLDYSESVINLPAENKAFALDDESGTEYLVTLYARQTLNIQAVMRSFNSSRGSIRERLSAAVGRNLLPELSFNEADASFSAQTDNAQAVAALIVAIEHK